MKSLDVIVPVYNEQDCIRAFYERLSAALDALPYAARIIFIDDGSTDDSAAICARIIADDARVGLVRLSRNFGHQAALTAGLDLAQADAVVTMDADLQHPPEKLGEFLQCWENGAQIVSGVRVSGAQVGLFKRVTSALFYRLLNAISPVPVTANSPDFRLLDARVVEAVRRLREQSRFLRGIYSWVGFPRSEVRYEEGGRVGGRSKYGTVRMMWFALSAVLSFSRMPLRLATVFGLIVSALAFGFGIYALVMKLVFHEVIRGWTSTAVLISFLSGVQLITLGVLGEYLGQVLEESKQRPLYLIADQRVPQPSAGEAKN